MNLVKKIGDIFVAHLTWIRFSLDLFNLDSFRVSNAAKTKTKAIRISRFSLYRKHERLL